jgi:serine/threonine protein kinase
MGEVYRAKDTKLNRDVAIKVLPDAFAADADRVARFTREAQVLASLNHPNIAAIYGIESNALVMELVDGEDLSAIIARGAIPLADALPIARQIADALEAAHEQGIVHRDLKPQNIKVRADGTVKVLDFGLAKAMDPAGASGVDAMNSPTLTARATQMGMIIGTAAYMSPEQARGRAVDRRADVWAFGVVLYEMLTGRRCFEGEDISITLASVLKEDVSWQSLPADLPVPIRRLLRRCLEKDPKRRLSSIGDARLELDEASSPSDPVHVAAPRTGVSRWERAIWAAFAGVATVAAVFLGFGTADLPRATLPETRFAVTPPGAGVFSANPPRMSISPDGRYVVFAASAQPGKPDQLWLRRLDSLDVTPIPGTESVGDAAVPQSPFWSPDSRELAYFVQSGSQSNVRESRLLTIDLNGGGKRTICSLPSNNASGTWNAAGVILVTSQASNGIQRVSADGGEPVQVTTLDGSRKETAHLWPQFLPDGRHFIYVAQTANRAEWAVFLGSIDSSDRRKIVQSEYARVAAPNMLVYAKADNLIAQVMDPASHQLTGDPVVITRGILAVPTNGRVGFSVSDTGVLVYSADLERRAGVADHRLTWLDRAGNPVASVGPAVSGMSVRLSPDAKRAAVLELLPEQITGQGRSIWVADLSRDVKAPLMSTASSPTWSTDGARLRFGFRDQNGLFRIDERAANGATAPRTVDQDKNASLVPLDELADGTLLLSSSVVGTARGLYVRKADGTVTAYLADGADRPQAALSPDGKWIAYSSNESNVFEVIVQSFPDPSRGKWNISTSGGLAPRWRRDGRELFYVDGAQRLIAVEVATTPTFVPGKSTPLFLLPNLQLSTVSTGSYTYDVSPDGRQFLVSLPSAGGTGTAPRVIPLTVMTNWTSLMKGGKN